MRIFLTGAKGMVGRNLLEHPRAANHHWLAPTRQELDLLDSKAVERYLAEQRPDMILHAAGRVGGIQANLRSPVEFLVENFDIGKNVLLAAQKVRIWKVLNLGSTCMYPRDISGVLQEEMILSGPLEPTNEGYALAKISVQRLGAYLNAQYSMDCKTVVPCNLYGRWDNFKPESSHLLPSIIRKVHDALTCGADEVEIWGDGTARREFMDASDLADFLLEAIDRFDVLPGLMNVGLGFDFSINEYYATVAETLGYSGVFRHDLNRPVGMRRKLSDISKLQSFGWNASTGLAEGVRRAYEFYQSSLKEMRNP